MLNMATMWAQYLSEHCRNAKCFMPNPRAAAKEMCRYFGEERDVEAITQDELQGFIGKRMDVDGVKGPTVRKTMTLYYAAANYAKKRKRIKEFEKVDLPPKSQPRTRYLSVDECGRVITAAKSHGHRIWLMFWILLETACRSKAAEELTWDRVNLERRLIDLRVPGVEYKNKKRGKVAISDDLYAVLIVEAEWKDQTDLVIGPGGSTVHAAKTVMRAAGIDEPGVCRHVMRRTWASQAALNDVPMKRIAAQLHDRVETVDKHYAHLGAEDMMDTVNSFRRVPVAA